MSASTNVSNNDIADALVIFGITGDLAKKMTYKSLFNLQQKGNLDVRVVGVAMDDITTEQLTLQMRSALEAEGVKVARDQFEELSKKVTYIRGDFSDPKTYEELKRVLAGSKAPLFYLEIPPFLFAPVVENLCAVSLMERERRSGHGPRRQSPQRALFGLNRYSFGST